MSIVLIYNPFVSEFLLKPKLKLIEMEVVRKIRPKLEIRKFQFNHYPKILISRMATNEIKMGKVLIPFSGIVYFLVLPKLQV